MPQHFDLDAELDALIAELDSPTLEEVLAWFQPVPTLDGVLSSIANAEQHANQRALSGESLERVQKLRTEWNV